MTGGGGGAGGEAVLFGSVALAEFFHLVTALECGLGRVIEVVAATGGDDDGDFFPLAATEWAPLEGVPLLLVCAYEVYCLLMSPRDRLGFPRGCG